MVQTPDRFLAKPEGVPLFEGQKNFLDFTYFYNQYYDNQRRVLPSVYNETNASTTYALQLRARAREFARIRLFTEHVFNDGHLDITRSDFLYRNFGYLFKIKDPFFFPGKSDEFYRRFVQALASVLFRGTTKGAIAEGLGVFLEGIPYTVTQMYLDLLQKGQEGDKTLKNIFNVMLDLDNALPGADLSFAIQGLHFFLSIMKPSHNFVKVGWNLSDKFNIQGGCTVNFDLIMGETIAEQVKVPLTGGIEIVDITENIVTLADSTILFLTDFTDVLDDNDIQIPFSTLTVGLFVTYEGHASTGRYQYVAPITQMPLDLWYTSLGYPRTPLVEEVDDAFIHRNDFLFYAKKLMTSSGFESQTKATGAICDRLKSSVYTWYYEDFRKCGLPVEKYVDKEDVSATYNATDKTVRVTHVPIVKGVGDYTVADLVDVDVYVNSVLVSISDISVFTGLITLTLAAPINAVIEVSYYYSENVNYTLEENEEGELFNQSADVFGSTTARYGSVLNQGFVPEQKKTRWKTSAFLLKASSLENIPYTLTHNTDTQYGNKFNQARIVKNYEERACKVFAKTAALGLSTEGECLNYPTPPVQLRYDANASIPDPWIILPGSDLLNADGEFLNDTMLLNQVDRMLYYGPYSKKYSFYDIETEECGGDLIPKPFCDDERNSFGTHIGGTDYTDVYTIPPELDVLIFNDPETLENEDIFLDANRTKLEVSVHAFESDAVPAVVEDLVKVNFDTLLEDTYKNIPLNILIENDAVAGGPSTAPIYGFDDQALNDGMDLNQTGDILNEASIVQIGSEPIDLTVTIPPSRVHPIDGIDVVPLALKSNPGDTNYIFLVRERFDEEVVTESITNSVSDEYEFVHEKYSLNNPNFWLNMPMGFLNSNFEELSWSVGYGMSDTVPLATESMDMSIGYADAMPPIDDSAPLIVVILDYMYQAVLNDSRLKLNDDMMVLNDEYVRRLLSTQRFEIGSNAMPQSVSSNVVKLSEYIPSVMPYDYTLQPIDWKKLRAA